MPASSTKKNCTPIAADSTTLMEITIAAPTKHRKSMTEPTAPLLSDLAADR